MMLLQVSCKETAKGCAVIVSFLYVSPVSIWGYGLLWLSKPTSFFTERKQGNDSNQLAPDGTANASSSYMLHTRAQFAPHETLIKCPQPS
jgi:hypothetical protein